MTSIYVVVSQYALELQRGYDATDGYPFVNLPGPANAPCAVPVPIICNYTSFWEEAEFSLIIIQ